MVLLLYRAPSSISLRWNPSWNRTCMRHLHSYKFASLIHIEPLSHSSPTLRYFSHDQHHGNKLPSSSPLGPRTTTTATNTTESIVYEGPFASLALRLKRISITTAAASIVGIPMLMTFGSNLPPSGQLAVGGTAILAATGSTAALSFCFSPYIHTLEWIPVRQCKVPAGVTPNEGGEDGEEEEKGEISREEKDKKQETETSKCQKLLLKATTRNVFAMKVETVFDPDVDVTHDPKSYRPFCNFMVRGKPFFIHPELIKDDLLRIQLLGTDKVALTANGGDTSNRNDKKKRIDPDDEFI